MRTFRNIMAIIPCLGIISWLITDWFGALITYLVLYGVIIIPLILLYLLSLFEMIYSTVKNGIKRNLIKFISHLLTFLFIIFFIIIHCESLKSPRYLTAILDSDSDSFELVLRENGKFENTVSGMFGYAETYKGKFYQYEDTIIFKNRPYDKDFIPDTILLDKIQNAIFIKRDSSGNFYTEKQFLNHYEIINNND